MNFKEGVLVCLVCGMIVSPLYECFHANVCRKHDDEAAKISFYQVQPDTAPTASGTYQIYNRGLRQSDRTV